MSEPDPWSLSDLFRKRFPKTIRRSLSKNRVSGPKPPAHSTPNLLPRPPSTSTSVTSLPVPSSDRIDVGIAPRPAAWGAFIQALEALESGLGAFPPLKSAIGGLVSCVQRVEMAQRNQIEYERLALDLTSLVSQLQSHLPDSRQARMPYSIANIARAIEEHTAYLERKRRQSGVVGHVMAREENEDVLERYRSSPCFVDSRQVHAVAQRAESLRNAQLDVSLSTWSLIHEQWTDTRMKDLAPAKSAYYNSALSMEIQRCGCTKDTREKILDDARTWTRNPDAPKIYWMNGMAGTGKTTIAYSLCEKLDMNGQLGGSFFCSRNSPDCRDVSRIVPTIAYQLARFSNPYQSALCEALGNEPDIAGRKVDVQFKKLILDPFMKVNDTLPDDVVIVIDALDECADRNGMRLVLDLVFRYATELPVKFFITSRPEPIISGKIGRHDSMSRSILHLHDIEKSLVQADIQLYLADALAPICPAEKDVERLATRAGCLFIFAATVVRYISPETPSLNHSKRLAVMLQAASTAHQGNYKPIDDLYSTILANALEDPVLEEDEKQTRRLVLWTVICAREPLSASVLAQIFDVKDQKELENALEPMRSVLHVSGTNGAISTLHASFPDFLLSDGRAGRFVCNQANHEQYLASRSFAIMARQLRFNICNLESSYLLDSDIPDLAARVERSISSGLSYTCRYWGDHLARAKATTEMTSQLEEFLKHRFLFWVEALNLKGWASQAENTLTQVLVWLPKSDGLAEIHQFVCDARNFVTLFATKTVSCSTPHIYISALPFTSKESHIRSHYWPLTRGLATAEGAVMTSRGKAALASWPTESHVNCLALMPDGQRIVSGLNDGKISIWDVSKGALTLARLHGHQDSVWSVAISPDGSRIASGSSDCTIIIWSIDTGNVLAGPLHGHTKIVSGLAFSPNNALLVSGSEDHTMRMWDGHNGTWLGKSFAGHEDCVMSVAFSPDGKCIASGSDDRTIRLWDPETCVTIAGPFVGHTDWIDCIAFSPDGKRIVSSSRDRTVRVWDSYSGEAVAGPLEGHTGRVISVTFSPDGTRVASGSFDRTVCIWDSYDGRLLAGPFDGHRGNVNAVVFSTDGTRVYSGSDDKTIRVWDARDGITGGNATSGHTSGIGCVVFSPDGTRAASGSSDCTVCVWDTHTGALVTGPFTGHKDWVRAVSFSPDGTRIVSGADDCTLCTWDASTGALLATPFEGHTDWVRSVTFSPDGSQIASGSSDATIRLWNSNTGALTAPPFTGHTARVQSVAFSHDGARIVSASLDATVRMWDASNGNLVWMFDAHTDWVLRVLFTPDGTRVVSGSLECKVLALDARDGAVLHGPVTGPTDRAFRLALSSDGTRVVSFSDGQRVDVWDVQSGKIIAGPLREYGGNIWSVAFSPDGTRLLAGFADGVVRVWDIAPFIQPTTSSFHDWFINDDGWLINSDSQRILWLPSDIRHRISLSSASNSAVTAGGCTICIDDTLLVGNRWGECYDVSQRRIPA